MGRLVNNLPGSPKPTWMQIGGGIRNSHNSNNHNTSNNGNSNNHQTNNHHSNNHNHGSSSSNTNTPHPRQYMLPVPSVPQQIAKIIRDVSKPQIQQNKMRILTAKLHDQKEKVAASQNKLDELEIQKEEGLRDIRESRQEETQQNILNYERKLRAKYEKDKNEAEQIWKEKIDKECNIKREEFRKKRLTNITKEEDDATKRIKLLEEAELNTASISNIDNNKKTADPTTVNEIPGAIAAIVQPAVDAVVIQSDSLRKEAHAIQNEINILNESKTEMIWLLKQVIKAEEKQKHAININNSESKTLSSRQA